MTDSTLNIDTLLAFHHATFGDARMEDAPPPPPPPDPPKPDYTPPASQADLDRIINDRLGRERQKFADYKDLQAKATELDQLKAANASEQEKAVKAAVDEALKAERQRSNSVLVSAEARALAAAAKAKNPEVVVRNLDLSAVKVTDDGQVDAAAIKTALDDLAKSEPYLFGDDAPPPPPPFNGGPRPTVPLAPDNPRAADLAQIEADIKAGKRH